MKPVSWSLGPTAPDLPAPEIHLWKLGPWDRIDEQDWRTVLSTEELKRADRLRIAEKRQQFGACRFQVRTILGRYLRQSPSTLAFATTATGKPFLRDSTTLSFNHSHSGSLGLLAVSRHPLGVDLEQCNPRDVVPLARRFFSPSEIRDVEESDNPLPPFYRIWTAKEAVLKAHGAGLTLPLHSFSVPESAVGVIRLGAADWQLWCFCPAAGYQGAVCCSDTLPINALKWYTLPC